MKVKIAFVFLQTLFSVSGIWGKSEAKKCLFSESVNLTNIPPDENGAYLYHNILIPNENVHEFDYVEGFRNKIITTRKHLRGCICGEDHQRYCVKFCCELGEYFDENENRCEKLNDRTVISTNITVLMEDDTEREIDIFENFVPQVGLPCESPLPLLPEKESWVLMEYGYLKIDHHILLSTNSYCYSPVENAVQNRAELVPYSCPRLNEASFLLLLNSYGMCISVVFFILTALIYLAIKDLRRSLRGRLLISYLLSMSVAYIIWAIINTSQVIFSAIPCMVMGFICYFSIMSAFLWLGVLSFDIWISFANTQIRPNWEKRLFPIYSLFVWCTAGIFLIIVICCQFSDAVSEAFKPGINEEMCWINTQKWSAAIYYYVPSLIIFLFNIIIFARVCIHIYRDRRNMTSLTTKQKFFHENALFILRLFIIMGISWIMDIISYFFRNYTLSEYIFAFTDFYNAIQGVCVFILLVCKRKIFALIKKRIFLIKDDKNPHSREVSETTIQ